MFGISGEHLLVLLVILLIFGPRRLPDLGHSLGRTLKNFKDAMAGNEAQQETPVAAAQIDNKKEAAEVTKETTKETEKKPIFPS
jgi:sec-independent protein translocase protein TatA